MASPWGPNSDIMDQRWNKVSAHVDWISKIIKGTKAEQCQPKKKKHGTGKDKNKSKL